MERVSLLAVERWTLASDWFPEERGGLWKDGDRHMISCQKDGARGRIGFMKDGLRRVIGLWKMEPATWVAEKRWSRQRDWRSLYGPTVSGYRHWPAVKPLCSWVHFVFAAQLSPSPTAQPSAARMRSEASCSLLAESETNHEAGFCLQCFDYSNVKIPWKAALFKEI